MNTEQIVSLIGSLGFPIAVAWYLLTKLSPTITKNTEALTSLKEAVQKLCEKVNGKNEKT